ncbi:MAG: hypothetical protein NUW06_06340 [Candidatus Acetothermia bacterium]|nr:hypothetical protein [Candidatus Acetothermia bacterium]
MRNSRRAVGLLLLLGLLACSGLALLGNPIPVPTLLMPEEYIDALIFADMGRVRAVVEGVYPFANFGVYAATMYYPVPPDATGISVWLDGAELEWRYVTSGCEISPYYPTAVGDYRMIAWQIEAAPERFQIKVRYEHELPQLGARYAFVYALGTGRFLEYYAKETTAYVKVRLELGLSAVEAFLGSLPVACEVDQEAGEAVMTLVQKSQPFQPLTEDLLILFERSLSIPEAIDADGDGRISDGEMLQAIRYWIDDAPVPGTDGQRISDLMLHKLAEFWFFGERFVLASYQARERAIAHLLATIPDFPLTMGVIWDAVRATPEGLLGYETIRYAHGEWQIDVGYPVIPYPDYDLTVSNSATGFSWRGRVRAPGLIVD